MTPPSFSDLDGSPAFDDVARLFHDQAMGDLKPLAHYLEIAPVGSWPQFVSAWCSLGGLNDHPSAAVAGAASSDRGDLHVLRGPKGLEIFWDPESELLALSPEGLRPRANPRNPAPDRVNADVEAHRDAASTIRHGMQSDPAARAESALDEAASPDGHEASDHRHVQASTPAQRDLVDPFLGQVIGPYRLEAELGRGSQGVVFRAWDTHLRRNVALKLFQSQGMILLDPELLEQHRRRFEREALLAVRIDHPCVAKVYQTGTWQPDRASLLGPMLWMAMQYVEGQSLAKLISASANRGARRAEQVAVRGPGGGPEDRGAAVPLPEPADEKAPRQTTEDAGAAPAADPLSATNAAHSTSSSQFERRQIQKVLEFFEAAARALAAAHKAGVLHRDIKPGNIMVRPDGSPVLLDFGLARADAPEGEPQAGAALPSLQTEGVFGTRAYMSPEQSIGAHDRMNARTDIWSLGMSLFEALSMRRPFEGATPEKLIHAIQQEPPPDIRRLNPRISRDLKVVVETALAKEPKDRYATAEAFAEDLRRVRNAEPILARPAGPAKKVTSWARRNPWLAAAAGVALMALLSVVGVTLNANRELNALNVALLTETERAQQNERLAAAESAEKSVALNEYGRLADIQRLQNARNELGELWPIDPKIVEPLRAWQQRYASLFAVLPDHRKALEALRKKALPYTDEDRKRDFATEISALNKAETERLQVLAAVERAKSTLREAEERAKDAEQVATRLTEADSASAERVAADTAAEEAVTAVTATGLTLKESETALRAADDEIASLRAKIAGRSSYSFGKNFDLQFRDHVTLLL